MRRVTLTISHLALIALALTALCIATLVWFWEMAAADVTESASVPEYKDYFAEDGLPAAPEVENASAAD